jgi:hypothetical protein
VHPEPFAILSGVPYGVVAVTSVFLFMFRGRSATFAGLVNRLTSLLAGVAATLITAALFHSAWPSLSDWASVALIAVAVWFLGRAELRRASELRTAAA